MSITFPPVTCATGLNVASIHYRLSVLFFQILKVLSWYFVLQMMIWCKHLQFYNEVKEKQHVYEHYVE